MIRLLIIGRDADSWASRLASWEGEAFEVDTEQLPSAGIRNFAETSPDAVAIAEPDGSPKIEPTVEAILERPLGQIVPILTLGGAYRGDADLPIAAEVGDRAGGEEVVDRLEALLEVELTRHARHADTSSQSELEVEPSGADEPTYQSTQIPAREDERESDDEQFARDTAAEQRRAELESRIERPDYVIERIDDGADGTVQGPGGAESDPPAVADAESIRRKIEEVRHEDYFAILEVAREVGGERLREAYRRQKRRFRPERLPEGVAEEFEDELAEIHDALDDARAVLGDDRLRAAYRAETSDE